MILEKTFKLFYKREHTHGDFVNTSLYHRVAKSWTELKLLSTHTYDNGDTLTDSKEKTYVRFLGIQIILPLIKILNFQDTNGDG